MALDPVLVGLSFSAGVLSFFSPCSVALLPAYLAWFMGLEGEEDRVPGPREGLVAGLRQGGAATLGILALFTAVGVLLVAAGSAVRPVLGPGVTWGGVLVGVGLAGLGGLMLLDRAPAVSLPLRAPRTKSFPSVFAFGVVFAVGSVGCTLPLFLSVVANAFQAGGALAGLAIYLTYAAGMGGLMLVLSALLGVSKERTVHRLRALVPHVRTASAILLVAAGAYLVWYYAPLLL